MEELSDWLAADYYITKKKATAPPKIIEFPCEICKRVFKSKGGLSLHISKRQTPCDQEYKCFRCVFKT